MTAGGAEVTAAAETAAARRRRRPALAEMSRHAMFGCQIGLLVLVVAVWHFASGTFINDFFVSNPLDVAERLVQWTADGSIFIHAWVTTYETVAGFALGAAVGIVLGIWLGGSESASRLLNPFLLAFYALPKPALAPLFVLWFGLGAEPKIALAALLVFFLVFYNTYVGVRQVDRELIDIVRLMRGSRRDVLIKVVMPSALGWIFSGMQISVPYALIGAIVGEMIASNQGLGFLVQRSGAEFDTAGVFAALVVIGILGVAFNKLVDSVQVRLEAWKVVAR